MLFTLSTYDDKTVSYSATPMGELIKHNKQILLILGITLVFRLLASQLTEPYILLQQDSDEYSNFDKNIFLGQVDVARTPVYPLFIMFVRWISFSSDPYVPVVVAQEIISLISLVFMYKIVRRYTSDAKLIYVLTLVYALQPTIWHWNKCILTESLSISFGVMFAWLLIRHLDKPKTWSAIVISTGGFLAVMLRPALLSLFAVITVSWVVRFILSNPDRKQSIIGLGTSLFFIALLFGYVKLNHYQNGLKDISTVSTANQIMNLIDADIYENLEYPDIVDSLTSSKYWDDRKDTQFLLGWMPIDKKFGFDFHPEYVKSYVHDTIKLHSKDYVQYMGRKFKKSIYNPVPSIVYMSTPANFWDDIISNKFDYNTFQKWLQEQYDDSTNLIAIVFLTILALFVPFSLVYIYTLCVLIYAIIRWCKGQLDWVDMGFSLVIISALITNTLGGPMEHLSRLFQPTLPFLFILVYKHIAEGRFRWVKMRWLTSRLEKCFQGQD